MIVLNNFPVNNNDPGDTKFNTVMIPSSKKEAPIIANSKLGDKYRSVTLEKSINFLQGQHEAMLNGLHQEIESLKKANKGSCLVRVLLFFKTCNIDWRCVRVLLVPLIITCYKVRLVLYI